MKSVPRVLLFWLVCAAGGLVGGKSLFPSEKSNKTSSITSVPSLETHSTLSSPTNSSNATTSASYDTRLASNTSSSSNDTTNSTNTTNSSTAKTSTNETETVCRPAFEKPGPGPTCHPYHNRTIGLCNKSIAVNSLVHVKEIDQIEREYKLKSVRIKPDFFRNTLPNPTILLRIPCFQIIQDMYCHFYFPRCDMTSSTPRPQAICSEACEMLNFRCKAKWISLMLLHTGVTWYAQDEIGEKIEEHETFDSYKYKNVLMKCKGLPRMNGPDTPECYIPDTLLYHKTRIESASGFSNNCYYGNGYAYRGNVSVTKSGNKCQSWSDQCPHRHLRTPENYKELVGAGNACRNPGHQAPLGPWCYTTNPVLRWEYCNIETCELVNNQSYNQGLPQSQGQPILLSLGNPPHSSGLTQQGASKVNSLKNKRHLYNQQQQGANSGR